MLRLLIADDHPLYRDALKDALASGFENLELLESGGLQETIVLLHENPDLDLLLLDLHMPDSGDLFGLVHIRKLFPSLPIVVISGLEDSNIINKVVGVGALGFIAKTGGAKQICSAVRTILDGDIWVPPSALPVNFEVDDEFATLVAKISSLTPAQYKVLCYMSDGLLNKQIGFNLDIATATVKAHVTAIFKKLGINNRTQAVLIAAQLQLEPPS